ncbi:hypothetical protein [Streptomyces spiralis]|uniref:hypothetical protein n=1 Tax=Streptomyces spiralis TaxID=66376 RepID=UPI0036858D4F
MSPAAVEAYPGELEMLRSLVRTLRVVVREDDALMGEVRLLLWQHVSDEASARIQGKSSRAAADATPTDTNRRARLLHEISLGGRWKSGDVVRWYATQGLTGLGVRAARRDLAVLRDSGRLVQHDVKGVRYFTLSGS